MMNPSLSAPPENPEAHFPSSPVRMYDDGGTVKVFDPIFKSTGGPVFTMEQLIVPRASLIDFATESGNMIWVVPKKGMMELMR